MKTVHYILIIGAQSVLTAILIYFLLQKPKNTAQLTAPTVDSVRFEIRRGLSLISANLDTLKSSAAAESASRSRIDRVLNLQNDQIKMIRGQIQFQKQSLARETAELDSLEKAYLTTPKTAFNPWKK